MEFQLTAARDQLRAAEDQVLKLQGEEKQYEILLSAVVEAQESARREKDALRDRDASDRERFAAQRTKVRLFTADLDKIRAQLLTLEGSQTEAAEASAAATEKMTLLRTEAAALDAERATAEDHIRDLTALRTSMEGDRDKKLLLIDTIREDQHRLEQQILELTQRQQENDRDAARMNEELRQLQQQRIECEAAKTKAEREIQNRNKDILNMEKACALLEQKKTTTAMEESQIVDKLWDSYELTPGTAFNSIVTMILTLCFGLFAYTTLLGMISFGEIAANRISSSRKFINGVRIVSLVALGFGILCSIAGLNLGNLWAFSDLGNILIVFANLPLLYLGLKYVTRATAHYKKQDGTPFDSKVAGTELPYWDSRK